MNYIGIIGHRGSGRETLAWLIAKTLEFRKRGVDLYLYAEKYREWCDQVIADKSTIGSTNQVVLDSFGSYILDTLKVMHADLRPIDLTDEDELTKYYVRMSDLWVCTSVELGDCYPMPLDDYMNYLNEYRDGDQFPDMGGIYLCLADFIIFWADRVMKYNFGEDFFINMMAAEARENAADQWLDNQITILCDIKTDAERDFISQHNGLIIQLENAERKRNGGYRKMRKQYNPDCSITLHQGLKEDYEEVWDLTDQILTKFNLNYD